MDSVDFADATRNPPTFEEFEENVGEALVSAISAAFPDRDIGESVAAIRDLSSEYDLSFSDAVLVATAIDGDPEVSGLADFAIARPCLESFGTPVCPRLLASTIPKMPRMIPVSAMTPKIPNIMAAPPVINAATAIPLTGGLVPSACNLGPDSG